MQWPCERENRTGTRLKHARFWKKSRECFVPRCVKILPVLFRIETIKRFVHTFTRFQKSINRKKKKKSTRWIATDVSSRNRLVEISSDRNRDRAHRTGTREISVGCRACICMSKGCKSPLPSPGGFERVCWLYARDLRVYVYEVTLLKAFQTSRVSPSVRSPPSIFPFVDLTRRGRRRRRRGEERLSEWRSGLVDGKAARGVCDTRGNEELRRPRGVEGTLREIAFKASLE